MSDIIRDGIIKTKKDHICNGCLKVIPKGTQVYSQTCVDEDIWTIYMCEDCKDYCKNKKCTDCYEMENATEGFIKECRRENGEKI